MFILLGIAFNFIKLQYEDLTYLTKLLFLPKFICGGSCWGFNRLSFHLSFLTHCD